MDKKEIYSSFIWLLFALLVCFGAFWSLPVGSWKNPGPGFLPLGGGIFLGIFSIINIIKATLERYSKEQASFFSGQGRRNILLVLGALFAYAMVLEELGYLINTMGLLIYIFKIVERKKWFISIVGSFLGTFLFYGIFELWLKSNLPKGILGF